MDKRYWFKKHWYGVNKGKVTASRRQALLAGKRRTMVSVRRLADRGVNITLNRDGYCGIQIGKVGLIR